VTRSRPHRTPDEYVDTIDIIAEQAKRLSRLVEDLFLLSRADVKATPVATSRFYLDDVLADCVRAAGMLGRSKAIRFELSGASDLEIEGDEDLIRRMLMNLMENAVRYNDDGTTVRVTLSRHGADAEIAIADNGKGIPRHDRTRIFERFVRLDPKSSSGAGLGLPIARWIAEAHRGSLVLADTTAGTTFIVRLPLQVDILAAEVT
jgi:signal transduction histidine kinase